MSTDPRDDGYDPKSALKKFEDAGFLKGKPVGRPTGPAYEVTSRLPFLCFPLLAFTAKDEALPEDIRSLPTSSKALKEHERPDGAVYLGAFELPNDANSTMIVFGDPMATPLQAKMASIQFRRRITRLAYDRADRQDQGPDHGLDHGPELVS